MRLINPIYENLAKIVVEYSLEVEKGHQVVITGPTIAKEFFQVLNIEIIKLGAHPFVLPSMEGIRESFFKNASEEQLLFVNDVEKLLYQKFDRLIQIDADYNTRKYSSVEPEKITKFGAAPERKKVREIFEKRVTEGEVK